MRKIVLVIIFLYSSLNTALGQNFYKDMITPKNKVMIGIGPAIMYSNTWGGFRAMDFKILPSFTAGYSYQVNPHLSIRTSAGLQWVESNLSLSDEIKQAWGQMNRAHAFQGQAYYIDLMPVVQLFPARHQGETFNVYLGIGLGFMQVYSEQQRMVDYQNISSREQVGTAYIPFRVGIGQKLNETWELLLEGTIMGTFSDELDGNPGTKRIQNDHLLQAQLILKKYF